MTDIADKLDEARALIEKGWTKGAYRRNALGDDLEDYDYDYEFEDASPANRDNGAKKTFGSFVADLEAELAGLAA